MRSADGAKRERCHAMRDIPLALTLIFVRCLCAVAYYDVAERRRQLLCYAMLMAASVYSHHARVFCAEDGCHELLL